MILAAAACAEGDGPPPPELELGWQARRWPGALPEVGGLRDQRAGELRRIAAALNVYDAIKSWRGSTDWVRWKQAHPEQWKTVARVIVLREERA